MLERIIVSRHPAAIEHVARNLHPDWNPPVREGDLLVWRPLGLEPDDPEFGRTYDAVRVVAEATPADVTGKVVYGNLPLHLAALAAQVWVIEFVAKECPACKGWGTVRGAEALIGNPNQPGAPGNCPTCNGAGTVGGRSPRGTEYSLADMEAAGATLRQYTIYYGAGPLTLSRASQGEIERELWNRGLGEILRPHAERA